jgi:hypothetical protein
VRIPGPRHRGKGGRTELRRTPSAGAVSGR